MTEAAKAPNLEQIAAERALDAARTSLASPRAPGRRAAHRAALVEARAHAIAAEMGASTKQERLAALRVRSEIAAWAAEDALHGAIQLAASAQRAPKPEECEDGWERVAEIAEAASRAVDEAKAAALAIEALRGSAPRSVVGWVERAARAEAAARALIADRNHAYTLHTDRGFSFGEGWYLAAASVLAGVSIQIEPGGASAAQAERFLVEAGLRDRLQPYRPRPRANKATTEIVAREFRRDPAGAQARLRSAFLGDEPMMAEVRAELEGRLGRATPAKSVLIWSRKGTHQPERNSDDAELVRWVALAQSVGARVMLMGDPLESSAGLPAGTLDLMHFWKAPIHLGERGRRAQLQAFELLRAEYGVIGQLGVTTAGMDGPALMGLPTMYVTDAPNPRIGAWVGAVPDYVEIVRDGALEAKLAAGIAEWTLR